MQRREVINENGRLTADQSPLTQQLRDTFQQNQVMGVSVPLTNKRNDGESVDAG